MSEIDKRAELSRALFRKVPHEGMSDPDPDYWAATTPTDPAASRSGQAELMERCGCRTATWCMHFKRCLAESLPDEIALSTPCGACAEKDRQLSRLRMVNDSVCAFGDKWVERAEAAQSTLAALRAEKGAEANPIVSVTDSKGNTWVMQTPQTSEQARQDLVTLAEKDRDYAKLCEAHDARAAVLAECEAAKDQLARKYANLQDACDVQEKILSELSAITGCSSPDSSAEIEQVRCAYERAAIAEARVADLCIGLAMTQTELTAAQNLVSSMRISADTTTQNVLQDRTKK